MCKEQKEQFSGAKKAVNKEVAEKKVVVEEKEVLFQDTNRLVLFPIEHKDIFDAYKKQVASYWTVEDVELSKDVTDWNEKLTKDERYFISHVLAFFAASDGIVLENLALRFIKEVKIPEARSAYAIQMAIETIHSEMYSLLIDTYIKDSREKERLFNAIENIDCVKEKANWALKWIENNEDFGVRLIAFAAVEGIQFSASFCAIYWLKQRGLMPGLTLSNELISRDEAMHTDFACLLYSKLAKKVDEEKVHQIIKEAVGIEKKFITKSIPCKLIDMNETLMKQYIEFVADRLLLQLGYKKLYNVQNPFKFMEFISLRGKVNFFEKRNGDYIKSGVGKSVEDNSIICTDDF